MNYITTFNAFIQQLNLPGIRVMSSDLSYKLHAPDEALRAGLLVVDPGIEEFYRQVEYMHTEWLYDIDHNMQNILLLDPESNIIAGSMAISSFSEMITKRDCDLVFNGKNFKVFDRVSSEYVVCFQLNGNMFSDRLFWVDILRGDPPVALNIGLEEYLSTGFENYFMYGWQKAAFMQDTISQKYILHYTKQLFSKKN